VVVGHGAGAQEHWKSLKTDQFLQVQGTGGTILAMGDAATVAQVCHMHAGRLLCCPVSQSMLGLQGGSRRVCVMGVLQQLQPCCSQI